MSLTADMGMAMDGSGGMTVLQATTIMEGSEEDCLGYERYLRNVDQQPMVEPTPARSFLRSGIEELRAQAKISLGEQ